MRGEAVLVEPDRALALPGLSLMAGFRQPRVGAEIANAWGWLLNRAPRVARALEANPGSTQTMADVVAGFDFFNRRYGITDDKQRMSEVDRRVTYNEATDTIIIHQRLL